MLSKFPPKIRQNFKRFLKKSRNFLLNFQKIVNFSLFFTNFLKTSLASDPHYKPSLGKPPPEKFLRALMVQICCDDHLSFALNLKNVSLDSWPFICKCIFLSISHILHKIIYFSVLFNRTIIIIHQTEMWMKIDFQQ